MRVIMASLSTIRLLLFLTTSATLMHQTLGLNCYFCVDKNFEPSTEESFKSFFSYYGIWARTPPMCEGGKESCDDGECVTYRYGMILRLCMTKIALERKEFYTSGCSYENMGCKCNEDLCNGDGGEAEAKRIQPKAVSCYDCVENLGGPVSRGSGTDPDPASQTLLDLYGKGGQSKLGCKGEWPIKSCFGGCVTIRGQNSTANQIFRACTEAVTLDKFLPDDDKCFNHMENKVCMCEGNLCNECSKHVGEDCDEGGRKKKKVASTGFRPVSWGMGGVVFSGVVGVVMWRLQLDGS